MARRRPKRITAEERRSAFRFPVTGPRSQGRLRVGRTEFPVTIIDESAGGFAIEFDGTADCRIGDYLQLQVEGEWIRFRIAFLDLQDVGVERFEGCQLTSLTRLGLMRSLDDEQWKRERRKPGLTRLRAPLAAIRNHSLLAAAAAFIGGLVVVGSFGIRKLDRAYSLDPMKNDQSEARVVSVRDPLVLAPKVKLLKSEADAAARSVAEAVAPAGTAPVWAPTGSGRPITTAQTTKAAEKPRPLQPTITRSAGRALPSKRTVDKVDRELDKFAKQAAEVPELTEKLWHETTVRLAHPAFLLRADIAQRLQLSPTQQALLKRMLVEQRTADTSADNERDLTIGRRSLAILTTRQKYLLEELRHTLPDAQLPAGN
jgi:hypothetical protein